MAHQWQGPDGEFTLQFFSMREFDHPDLVDPNFLQDLDRIRMRCGFGLSVKDDARTMEELESLYASEIAKELSQGLPRGTLWASDSAHLYVAPTLVRCVDIKPSVPRVGDGSDLTLDERELELVWQIIQMKKDGKWPNLGLICETAHFHVDDTERLGARRPYFGVGVSR